MQLLPQYSIAVDQPIEVDVAAALIVDDDELEPLQLRPPLLLDDDYDGSSVRPFQRCCYCWC